METPGIAFDYAVHDAVRRRDPLVSDRISSAPQECRISGDPESKDLQVKAGAKAAYLD
jgi:hypothetical protein